MLFDYLITGGTLSFNPASSVRGPSHSIRRGQTPVLDAKEGIQLPGSIPVTAKTGEPLLVRLRGPVDGKALGPVLRAVKAAS
jgi:hypothetical protein